MLILMRWLNKKVKKGNIGKKQFSEETTTQLLPFDKIDLKTRAFMSDTPYTKVSTIVPLAPGEKLTTQNDRASQVKISKSSLTSIDNSKTVLLENGKIKLERGSDYVLQVMYHTVERKEMFLYH